MFGFEFFFWLLPTLGLIFLGVLAGGVTERRHFASLARREAANADFLVTNMKHVPQPDVVKQAALVGGQVVIGTDYFKTFLTGLRNLVGGEMKAAETLMVRARREALLRMIDEGRRLGAREIWNVRFSYCNISQMSGNKGAMCVEIHAYGTAVVRA
ncbi:MAG: YbjQ family protein [Phycisphaerae bacterium]